jgi:hypothetical protein
VASITSPLTLKQPTKELIAPGGPGISSAALGMRRDLLRSETSSTRSSWFADGRTERDGRKNKGSHCFRLLRMAALARLIMSWSKKTARPFAFEWQRSATCRSAAGCVARFRAHHRWLSRRRWASSREARHLSISVKFSITSFQQATTRLGEQGVPRHTRPRAARPVLPPAIQGGFANDEM